MAISKDTSATGAALRNIVDNQSWAQKHSNLVTSLVGLAATVAAWAATQPFATEPWVQTLILIVGFVATTAGVGVTPNGFTDSQVRKLRDEQAEIIGSTRLVVDEFEGTEQEPVDLDTQVREFNRERE